MDPSFCVFFYLPARTQLNAAHAQLNKKIETGNFDVLMGNLLISNEPLDGISRNLAGKYFSQQVNGLSQKI